MTTLIASTSAGSPTNFSVTTSAIDTTGANLLVAAIGSTNGSANTPVTDSKSNTWTAGTGYNDGTRRVQISYCLAPIVGSGHTFSSNAAVDCISVLALSAAGAMLFDQISGAAPGTTGSSLQPGSLTPAAANSILFTAFSSQNGNTSALAVDSGFSTPVGTVGHPGLSSNSAIAWKDLATPTATNPTWSWTGSFFRCASLLVLKPAVTGNLAAGIFYRQLLGV